MEDNGSNASLVKVWVVFLPQKKGDGGNVIPRSNESYHLSRESAVLGQSEIVENSEIDPRLGVKFEDGRVFLVEGSNTNGLDITDEEALREEVKKKTMSTLSEAQKIALGIPMAPRG